MKQNKKPRRINYGLIASIFLGLILAFTLHIYYRNIYPTFTTNVHTEPVSYSKAFWKASPSVVNIYSIPKKSNGKDDEVSLGAGVIMNGQGYIVTNKHVILDNSDISVVTSNHRYSATLIGTDTLTDIAVIKIDPIDTLPLPPIEESPNYTIGDLVLAIGNPYNLGQSINMGIISGIGRSALNNPAYQNFIQTDAAISIGNSGGALINVNGDIIGIISLAIENGSQPIGFALPISDVNFVLNQIITHGKVNRGYFGITTDVIQIIQSQEFFAEISSIDPKGPAYLAGIRVGDIIIAISGKPVTNPVVAISALTKSNPGTKYAINVERNGKSLTFDVIAGNAK